MTRHEAFIQKDWQTGGLASVVVTRVRTDGASEYGLFLVDLFCLGVKDAGFEGNLTKAEVDDFVAQRLPVEFKERIHPACAKKLIEGALAYAEKLGFSPPADFRKARKVLSGLDASDCPQEFTFGRDGRPCYIRGEDDSDERVDRILAILTNRCGEDGFGYEDPEADLAELGDSLDESDDDSDDEDLFPEDEDPRAALMDWFEDRGLQDAEFHEFSGFLTALLLSPGNRGPAEAIRTLWGDPSPLKDLEDAQVFMNLLTHYWNYLNERVLDTVSPDAIPGMTPLDVWEEDFAEEGGLHLFTAIACWVGGFTRAVAQWPEDWRAVQARPELAPHWEVIGWWAQLEKQGNLARMKEAAEAEPPRTIGASIAAVTRALRQPID
jgi:yecA family protein